MFSGVAARSIAALFLVVLAAFVAPVPAFAQWQWAPTAIDPAVPSSQTQGIAAEPFGLTATPVTSGGVLTKWNGVVADIRAESKILEHCRNTTQLCPAAAQKFLAVIAEGRAHVGRARIGVVNRAINMAISPMSDLAQWGVPDRWSTPLATLTTGHGDCEDYAIAKYVALKEAGVAENDLRLVIVRDLAAGQDHAVAAAHVEGKWIVLDNRWLTLVEDVDMRRVVPLFALYDDGVKQFAPTTMADARRATAPEGAASAPAALGL
jgi:predicted transglutaminase-like cysteine proteinase